MNITDFRDALLAELDKHLAEENCKHLIENIWEDVAEK